MLRPIRSRLTPGTSTFSPNTSGSAIGTGNNCGVEETKQSVDFIRKFVPENTRILYGGSVKSENSGAYVKDAGANGLLVGGASLNAEEFVKIVKSAE